MSHVEEQLKTKILAENFSCVGAKASINRGKYQFCLLDKIATENSTKILYEALKAYSKIRNSLDNRFASFIACFTNTRDMQPKEFETLLWLQLKMLHEIDEFSWDKSVSSDINSTSFSFSIAGEAYFIVGLCPNHPRKCRNFNYPTLVFNSHHQFNYLKKINVFSKIQKTVRHRELHYSGSINPNLYLEDCSEALQYSGLKTSPLWQCPYSFSNNKKPSKLNSSRPPMVSELEETYFYDLPNDEACLTALPD